MNMSAGPELYINDECREPSHTPVHLQCRIIQRFALGCALRCGNQINIIDRSLNAVERSGTLLNDTPYKVYQI